MIQNKLERLSLNAKLSLGLVAILCVILALGAVGLYSQHTLNSKIQFLYETEVRGISSIKDARLELSKMGRALRQAILAQDKAEQNRAIGLWRDAEAGIRREIENSRSRIFGESNKVHLARFEDQYRTYKAQSEAILNLLERDRAEAVAQVSSMNFPRGAIASDETLAQVADAIPRRPS